VNPVAPKTATAVVVSLALIRLANLIKIAGTVLRAGYAPALLTRHALFALTFIEIAPSITTIRFFRHIA
jgi:hypothetical protein